MVNDELIGGSSRFMLYLIPLGLTTQNFTIHIIPPYNAKKEKKDKNWCQNRGVDTFRMLYNQTG